MKKICFLLFIVLSISIYAQTDSSFFDGKTFELDYFIKDNLREEVDLVHPNDPTGNSTLSIPVLIFSFNTDSNELSASINGYCNATSAKYKIEDNYLEVLERGGVTLMDCGESESLDYFYPLKGQVDYNQFTEKVFYEFTEDKKGLSIWIDENHKLYFRLKVLSIEDNELEKAIAIYPNPSKERINIDVKLASIKLSRISIVDFQGREIIKKTNNFKAIDISQISKGVYFLKMLSEDNLHFTKKIVKE